MWKMKRGGGGGALLWYSVLSLGECDIFTQQRPLTWPESVTRHDPRPTLIQPELMQRRRRPRLSRTRGLNVMAFNATQTAPCLKINCMEVNSVFSGSSSGSNMGAGVSAESGGLRRRSLAGKQQRAPWGPGIVRSGPGTRCRTWWRLPAGNAVVFKAAAGWSQSWGNLAVAGSNGARPWGPWPFICLH